MSAGDITNITGNKIVFVFLLHGPFVLLIRFSNVVGLVSSIGFFFSNSIVMVTRLRPLLLSLFFLSKCFQLITLSMSESLGKGT